jgi:hypothetical protein
VNRRGSDRGSEGIFDGGPAPPSHQLRLAGPTDDRLLVLVVAVASLRRRGGNKKPPQRWWLFASLILRDNPAGIGTKRVAPVAGLLRAVSLHHSG